MGPEDLPRETGKRQGNPGLSTEGIGVGYEGYPGAEALVKRHPRSRGQIDAFGPAAVRLRLGAN